MQLINHGYLAVDFFFRLSGFLNASAYDDRWHPKDRHMTLWDFFKCRFIRPLVTGTTTLQLDLLDRYPPCSQHPGWVGTYTLFSCFRDRVRGPEHTRWCIRNQSCT